MFLIFLLPFVGKKVAKQEDLKEMGDVSSGMSSSIMQLYLKQVLEAFFHTQSSVRHFALNVIALTLNQGLIHPVQVSGFRKKNLLKEPDLLPFDDIVMR